MWGTAEAYAVALRRRAPLELVSGGEALIGLDVARWLDDPDTADGTVLDRCVEPVLDVGCGPGRMVRACYDRDIAALGVDVAAEAVALSNSRGGPALLGDVFGDLPAEGSWATILLLDGNVGIGGDVCRLLTRIAALLAEDGVLIAEASPGARDERRMAVRLRVGGRLGSELFPWSVIGAAGLVGCARAAGLLLAERWDVDGREFLSFIREA
jgi:SAM-dependent methyltransferase